EQVGQTGIAAVTQGAIDGDKNQEGDASGAEIGKAGNVVGTSGINQRGGRRQVVIGQVVIDDQNIGAPIARMGDGPVAGGAAVERDDEAGAGIDQLVHGRDIGAVAFEDAVGNMDLRLETE